MEKIIRLSNPDNFESVNLCLAGLLNVQYTSSRLIIEVKPILLLVLNLVSNILECPSNSICSGRCDDAHWCNPSTKRGAVSVGNIRPTKSSPLISQFQHALVGKMKSQGKSTAAETVLFMTGCIFYLMQCHAKLYWCFEGDTDKGRKLAMAHKNVSFVLIPKIMMTTGEKIWRKTISRIQFWNLWELLQNFLMRGSRQTLPTLIEECSNTKLLCELAATTFDQGQAYSNSKVHWRIMSLNNCRVCPRIDFGDPPPPFPKTWQNIPLFHLVCKKGESPVPRSFLHRLQWTGSCSHDWTVRSQKKMTDVFYLYLYLMVSAGRETVSALSRSPMQCRIGLTSLTASKRCKNFSFLRRSHFAGRCVIWHKSSKLQTFNNDFIVGGISWRLCPQPRVQGGEE